MASRKIEIVMDRGAGKTECRLASLARERALAFVDDQARNPIQARAEVMDLLRGVCLAAHSAFPRTKETKGNLVAQWLFQRVEERVKHLDSQMSAERWRPGNGTTLQDMMAAFIHQDEPGSKE
jgi:hypothetical protein